MKIIEIAVRSNGAHRNRTGQFSRVPEGWAVIPEDMVIPDTFPFVEVTAQPVTYYRNAAVLRDVVKKREVMGRNGEPVTEEYTEQEVFMEKQPYTVLTVTSMTAGTVPEPETKPEKTAVLSTKERLDALEKRSEELAKAVQRLLSGGV